VYDKISGMAASQASLFFSDIVIYSFIEVLSRQKSERLPPVEKLQFNKHPTGTMEDKGQGQESISCGQQTVNSLCTPPPKSVI